MIRQPAKVLGPAELRRLLRHVEETRYPLRNRAMALLSFKAGLRACEMAGLSWEMVLTGHGKIGEGIAVARQIAKNGWGRQIPMHPELRDTLMALHEAQGRPWTGPLIRSERDGHMTARSVVNWFHVAYAAIGLSGCSSHSGRRTFITRSARLLQRTGGSLRDVQELAGHRALTTTERYIEGDRAAQRKLVGLV